RHTPKAPPFKFLADLEAIAKEAEVATHANRLVLDHGQAVVAGARGASEHALANAIDDRLLKGVATKGEQQKTDAWPAVRSLFRIEGPFNAGLGIATDHRGGVTSRGSCCRLGPGARFGGDQE